jgi:hypothetical protein
VRRWFPTGCPHLDQRAGRSRIAYPPRGLYSHSAAYHAPHQGHRLDSRPAGAKAGRGLDKTGPRLSGYSTAQRDLLRLEQGCLKDDLDQPTRGRLDNGRDILVHIVEIARLEAPDGHDHIQFRGPIKKGSMGFSPLDLWVVSTQGKAHNRTHAHTAVSQLSGG